MKGKKKGSDLWGEFWEKESGKSESPLATKKQGRKKTHPAEKREIVRSPRKVLHWLHVTCSTFLKCGKLCFCVAIFYIFAPLKATCVMCTCWALEGRPCCDCRKLPEILKLWVNCSFPAVVLK